MKILNTPEMQAILKQQRKAFKKKFGRYPRPDEPVFFDPDADTPQPLKQEEMEADTLSALKVSGAPAEIIYAYKKTGRLLLLDRRKVSSGRAG